jgi:hypothetical protein
MQNPRATTSLKPGVCDVFIAKRISQMNNGHHHRKWKSPILGVDELCFVTFFSLLFFLVYVEPKLFFLLSPGKFSSAAPTINCRAAFALSHVSKTVSERKAIELFNIPESDGSNNVDSITILPGKTFALRKLPILIEDQKYTPKCLELHSDNYHGMMRDIKTNVMQHTDVKLKKMATRFYLLANDQLRVEIPEKEWHLMACLQ